MSWLSKVFHKVEKNDIRPVGHFIKGNGAAIGIGTAVGAVTAPPLGLGVFGLTKLIEKIRGKHPHNNGPAPPSNVTHHPNNPAHGITQTTNNSSNNVKEADGNQFNTIIQSLLQLFTAILGLAVGLMERGNPQGTTQNETGQNPDQACNV